MLLTASRVHNPYLLLTASIHIHEITTEDRKLVFPVTYTIERYRRTAGPIKLVARDVAERCRRQCRSLTVTQKASRPSYGHLAMGPVLCSVGGGIVSSVSVNRARAVGILSNHSEVRTGL